MPSSSSSNIIPIVDYKKPFNVDLGSITEYFTSVLASDGNLDRGALKNGSRLFKDHFIHNINITRDYLHMIININRPADILEATCECVAGKGERAACKHLAALCFALLDYDQNKLYEACTQRLQQWHQPTRKSSNPVKVLDINFISVKHDKNEEEKPQYLHFLETDVHVPEATTTLRQLLVKYNQQSIAAASFLLPQPNLASFIPLPARVITERLKKREM
ncbi:unnamed protein product [Rotaria sp. Silwood2]|nr:unnamed protein product [Rotaria sp. Silwood2]